MERKNNTQNIIHEMKLTAKNFALMKSGEKHTEIRLYDEKRQRVHLGDRIKFWKLPELNEYVLARVVGFATYANFEDLFESVKGEYPDWSKKPFIEAMYRRYDAKDEEKYGVISIEVRREDKE